MLLPTGFQTHSRSELVIVQEADWTELAEYFNEKAPENVKKTVKTQAGAFGRSKRVVLCLRVASTETLGVKIQQDRREQPFKSEDDRGIEGVIVLPNSSKRKVVVGTRMSVDKTRQSEHESGGAMEQAFQNESASVMPEMNNQADIDQALAQPGVDESAQQQEVEPVPSDAESDGATFGLKRSGGGSGSSPRKRVRAKAKPGARSKSAAPSDREAPPVKKEKQVSAEKVQRTLDAAKAALRALKSMTPVLYWSGGAKEKDLQTKVGKALASCTALESLETNKDAESLREELQALVETTNSWSEILDKFRLSDPLMVLQIQTEDVAQLAKQIPVDAVAAVVTEIARKLVEAQSHNATMATKAFFRFIALANLDQPGLSLFAIHTTEGKNSGLDEKCLLRIQGNMFNIWLNSTKTTAETAAVLQSIPSELWLPNLAKASGDTPSTETLAIDGDSANCSGLVPRLLVDLQKFIACGKVSMDDQSMPDQGLLADPSKVNELKMVVTLPASPRVNLLFRAPGAIRTMWQRVLDISKRVIEERSALQQAAHIAESLEDLVNVLSQPESKRLQPAEIAKRIGLCARCHDLLAACKASQDPAAPEHVTKLEGLLSELASLLNDSYQNAGAFDQLMFCVWKAGDSVAAAMPDPAGPTAEQVLKEQIIAGRARGVVLHSEAVHNKMLAEMASCMWNFQQKVMKEGSCPTLGSDSAILEACCSLHRDLKEHTAVCERMLNSGDKTVWLGTCVGALQRLEDRLQAHLQQEIQEKGAEAIMKYMKDIKLPKCIQGYKDVLLQANFLQKLDGSTLKPATDETQAAAFSSLTSAAKQMVQMRSLDQKIIEVVLPGMIEKCKGFEEQVLQHISGMAIGAEESCSELTETLEKYRLFGFGVARSHVGFSLQRPILDAVEVWSMDSVRWMLDEDPAVTADVNYMFEFRHKTEGVLSFSRDITCLLQQAKRSSDDQAFLDDIVKVQKAVEDSRRDAAMILACMLTAATVVRANEAASGDNSKESLDEAREVSKCLSQKLGMSTKDLPGPLHQKFQAIGTTSIMEAKGSGGTLEGWRKQAAGAGCKEEVSDQDLLPQGDPQLCFPREEGRDQGPPKKLLKKAEVQYTPDIEDILKNLKEKKLPLQVTHTASLQDVKNNLDEWKPSAMKEFENLTKGKNALEVTKRHLLPPGCRLVPCKGVYTVKPDKGDMGFRRKTRFVACGNHVPEGETTFDLFAAGLDATSLRTMLAFTSGRSSWRWGVTDIRQAFVLAKWLGGPVVLQPPAIAYQMGLAEEGDVWLVRQAIYGLRESPAMWSQFRDSQLRLARWTVEIDGNPVVMKLEQLITDNQVWRIVREDGLGDPQGYLLVYIDDMLVNAEEKTMWGFFNWLSAKWEVDELDVMDYDHPIKFLGTELHRVPGGVEMGQEGFVKELLRSYHHNGNKSKVQGPKETLILSDEEERALIDAQPHDLTGKEEIIKEAQKRVGELLWLMGRSRPDLQHTVSIMSARITRCPELVNKIGERLLDYLSETVSYRLSFIHHEGKEFDLDIFTDSSFAPSGGRSHGSCAVFYNDCAVAWRSARQQLCTLSTAESELLEAVEGVVLGRATKGLLDELTGRDLRMNLLVDNAAAVTLLASLSGSWRTRHLRLRSNWLRELIQNKAVNLRHQPGEGQRADIGTKPFSKVRLEQLVKLWGIVDRRAATTTTARSARVNPTWLTTMLMLCQVCGSLGQKEDLQTEVPWDLYVIILILAVAVIGLWEGGKSCLKSRGPQVRALRAKADTATATRGKLTRNELKELQRMLMVEPSDLSDEQKIRLVELQDKFNETMPEGTSPVPRYPAELFQGFAESSSSSTATSSRTPAPSSYNKQPKGKEMKSVETQTDHVPAFTRVEPPPPPMIRTYAGPFYQVPGGDKFHVFPNCWGLRHASRTNSIEVCRCCAENGGKRIY
ncbi:RE1 [Symbiodinium sp. CCMP2592]|nr:RE1 [Symbiodinium sp. CCMP2592]